jgi:RNA-directed DNA polymerase
MTATYAGAPSAYAKNWRQVNWRTVEAYVYRMQVRIAESVRENRWGKAQALQHLLARSFYGRLWAVKRITANKGSRTPGIDGVTWNSPGKRWNAALNLNVRGYRTQPLRRIYILKKNGKKRPLGIPTLHDRAMQELFALGLRPIAETVGDKNSYGFRERRSLHDAIKMTFICLARKVSAQWVLEADIKACFDRISHDWLLENIPLPKWILRQWLKAGYMESSTLYPTKDGTPQGGIISPILCTMTLDGLEALVINGRNKKQGKLNTIRYADDFIITGANPEILLNEVKPEVERFLAERGLTLSEEKTKLSHIDNGSRTWAWIAKKCQKRIKGRVVFYARYMSAKGEIRTVQRFLAVDLPIRYHTKVHGDATPYDPKYAEYFANRKKSRKMAALRDKRRMNLSSFQKLTA